MRLFRQLLGDEDGQDFVEYAIGLAIISIGAGLAAVAMASNVSSVWSTASSAIHFVAG